MQRIDEAVGATDALVAIIGNSWLTVQDRGRRRLDNPQDFVRLEVGAGLRRDDVRVIPVLVHGAQAPAAEELPDDLAPLARRHALRLDDERWDYDLDRLVRSLRSVEQAKFGHRLATESKKRDPQTAHIELFRERSLAGMLGRVRVFVDGKSVGKLAIGGRWSARVAPGQHTLKLKQGLFRSPEVPLTLELDEHAQFRCRVRANGIELKRAN